jgi:hypothetical protein
VSKDCGGLSLAQCDGECCDGIHGVVLSYFDILKARIQYLALPTLLIMKSKNVKPE